MRKTIALLLAIVMVAFTCLTVSAEESVESVDESVETSEVSAETSEDSAETSEDSAETSEDSAETSEDSAETSEDSAETSEDSAETSEDSAETSEDSAETSEESVESDETSEDVVVGPAEITFTFTYSVNEDGTGLITVTLPAGIGNGSFTLKTSEDLTYVEGSKTTPIRATVNDLDPANAGIIVSFADAFGYNEGDVVLTATYNVAEGAEITEEDIIVTDWLIGDGTNNLASIADGDVIKVLPEAPVDDSTSEETSEESSVEESSEAEDNNDQPTTGDLGIAAFAVLAVISAGAVVVLKKRA